MRLKPFDTLYSKIVLLGISAAVWFAAFAQAAHDLWAGSILFGWVTLLCLIFCIGRFRDGRTIKLPLLAPAAAFLGWMWLSFRYSYDIGSTLFETWGWTFCWLIFYLFINVAESERDRDLFFTCAGMVIVPLAAVCVWQQVTLQPYGYGHWMLPGTPLSYSYGHWEIHATLVNSIVMAGFALYWPIFFWTQPRKSLSFKIAFGATLICLLLARSYWAYLCLLIGYLAYDQLRLTKWVRNRLAVTVLVTLFIGIFLIATFVFKIHNGHQGVYYLSTSRWYYWLTGLNLWRHNPIWGCGLGGFATAFSYFKIGPVQSTLFAHSFPLQWLAETGMGGVFAALYCLVDYFRLRGRSASAPLRLSVYDATLISILCFSLISINMDYLLNKMTFLIFIASTFSSYHLPSYPPRRVWIATLGGVLILISPFWLNLFAASRLFTTAKDLVYHEEISQAVQTYHDAISLDSTSTYSYWALSHLFEQAYERTHDRRNLIAAITYLEAAFSYKKDPQFFIEMSYYRRLLNAQISSSPSKIP